MRDLLGKPRVRRAGVVAGVVAGVLLVLGVGAALLVPTERIAGVVARRAEAALGARVEIGDVGVTLWPGPGAVLERVRVGDTAGPVASVRRVVLRPRLLPLLSRRVVVDEVVLERPLVFVKVDRDGRLNLALGGGGAGGGGGGGGIDFAVEQLRIEDGRFAYADARDGTVVRLDGVREELRLAGSLKAGQLERIALDGRLSVDSVGAVLPERLAVPVRGVRVASVHKGVLDLGADVLSVERLRLEVQQLGLEGSGRVEALTDSARRNVAIELRAEEFSAEDLVRSLPAGVLRALTGGAGAETEIPEVAGRASVRVRVEGPLGRGAVPSVEGAVGFSDVSVAVKRGEVLAGMGGNVAFSLDSLVSDGIRGRLLGEPFQLKFAVHEPADPDVEFAAAGALDLARATALAGVQDSVRAEGRVQLDVRGRVRPKAPAASALSGVVQPRAVRLATAKLLQPVSVTGGEARFEGSRLRAQGVQVAFGESRLALDAAVDGWLQRALGDTLAVPSVAFDVRAGTLDLDALLGPSKSEYAPLLFARLADRKLDGRTVEEAAEAAGLALPPLPRLKADGRFRAERILRNGLEYRDVDARVEATPQAVVVPSARLGLMGGEVELGARVTPAAEGAAVEVTYRIDGVGAAQFFNRFTPFREHLSGSLSLAGTAALELDAHALPKRPSVEAAGSIRLTEGHLVNWPVLRAAGTRMGFASFDTLAFRAWEGMFRVHGPGVSIQESLQRGEEMDARLAGTFDFAGRLDLGVTALLAPELAARAAEPIRQVARAVSGPDARVPVGLRITGTPKSPSVALDLTEAGQNVVTHARAAAEREARAFAEQKLRDALGGLPGDTTAARDSTAADTAAAGVTDPLRTRADSARNAIEQGLKDRLRKIVRPGS